MRFINDDVKVRQGGRNAVRMTINELRVILWKYIHTLEDAEDCFDLDSKLDSDLAGLIAVRDEKLQSDIKFANYCEDTIININKSNIKYVGNPLIGFHTLANGFTFYGALGGSECSWPMFSIFYYDGKRVRAYTPTRGNFVNVDFKSALGLEGEYYEVDENKILKKYQKLGLYKPSNTSNIGNSIFGGSFDDISYYELYLKKYGLTTDTVYLNFNAMAEEILHRIVV